ncbi:MAG: serine/threonine protein kinase [Deltaproteobacteria bacterium]|nr:serine/threonine protein kinase [Deltaproteobacteria bacterium]
MHEADEEIPSTPGAPESGSAGFYRWSDTITAGQRAVRLPSGAEVSSVRFGAFDLVGLLGTGGMARVYLALQDNQPGKQFALKVLNEDLATRPSSLVAFEDEARLSVMLVHRNIVRTVSHGAVGGRPFLAMQRVPGWNLEDVLRSLHRRGDVPSEPVVAALALEVARGMAYAHGMRDRWGNHLRLVHRDLKPGNMMISPRGAVRVMDFGIARWRNREGTTGRGWVKGTVGFMSPEQVLGIHITARSDIFSLGSALATMVLGRSPFERATLELAGQAILAADLAPVWDALVLALPTLHPLVARCLRPQPSERPSSAGVVAELEACVELHHPDVLAEWIGRIEPSLDPIPGPGHWPAGGPPEGLRRTRQEAGLTPSS